ncbi:MAG: tRNA (adenosine(37)-N6)-threonylcarbamoyltransferase complex dimerization subunit type 1 TsaB [Limnochordia bacterium]
MNILGIDTSAAMGGAAIVSEDGLAAEYTLKIHNGHSERIIPAVEQLLADSGLKLEDMAAFAVVTGPGSFTGIRVGLATIKGFAYSLGKPIIPVTAIEALAWQFQNFPHLICPIIDARRREVFTQLFRGGMPVQAAVNCKLSDLLRDLAAVDEPILFVGQGALDFQEDLAQLPQAVFPTSEQIGLRPGSVAGLGLNRLRQGAGQTWYEVLPFYMRKSSAEYQFDAAESKHEAGE